MSIVDDFTLDGVNDVTFVGGGLGSSTRTESWNDGWIGYLSQWVSGDQSLTSNVTLAGSDWTIAALRFGAEAGNTVNITDTSTSDVRINYLKLGTNTVRGNCMAARTELIC